MVEIVSFGYIWQNIVSYDLRKMGKRRHNALFSKVNIAVSQFRVRFLSLLRLRCDIGLI